MRNRNKLMILASNNDDYSIIIACCCGETVFYEFILSSFRSGYKKEQILLTRSVRSIDIYGICKANSKSQKRKFLNTNDSWAGKVDFLR